MSLLRVHGIPAPVGVTIVVSTAAVAATLARRRPEFAPELLREEALLAIALLGATVAAVPAVLDGWSAAANLTAFPGETSESVMPAWTLVLVAMALLTGAAHAMWSRR